MIDDKDPLEKIERKTKFGHCIRKLNRRTNAMKNNYEYVVLLLSGITLNRYYYGKITWTEEVSKWNTGKKFHDMDTQEWWIKISKKMS